MQSISFWNLCIYKERHTTVHVQILALEDRDLPVVTIVPEICLLSWQMLVEQGTDGAAM